MFTWKERKSPVENVGAPKVIRGFYCQRSDDFGRQTSPYFFAVPENVS